MQCQWTFSYMHIFATLSGCPVVTSDRTHTASLWLLSTSSCKILVSKQQQLSEHVWRTVIFGVSSLPEETRPDDDTGIRYTEFRACLHKDNISVATSVTMNYCATFWCATNTGHHWEHTFIIRFLTNKIVSKKWRPVRCSPLWASRSPESSVHFESYYSIDQF